MLTNIQLPPEVIEAIKNGIRYGVGFIFGYFLALIVKDK